MPEPAPIETDQQRFERLLLSRHPCIRIVTTDEDDALSLVRNATLVAGRELQLWSLVGGLRDGLIAEPPPHPDTEHPAAALFVRLRPEARGITVMLDLAPHLRDERTLRLLRELIARCRRTNDHVVLIDHAEAIPAVIAADATLFEPGLPTQEDMASLVRAVVQRLHREQPVQATLSASTFQALVRNLAGLSRRQAEQLVIEAVCDDRRLDDDDVEAIVARKRQLVQTTGLLEFVRSPVEMTEIGGLERLKAWLTTREGALAPRAAQFGLVPPRGMLLLGVQGAGKSLCAKAVSTAWRRPLFRMDVGALYDRYIGESERRLRDTLRQAERMAPMVLWIDEIEKAFASAASRSTDGGLSQRMFGTLLTWMQEHTAPVFLVATANDIEALPPELLRKGRFDEIFFVDLPPPATRREIFRIHVRKCRRDAAALDLDALVAASDGYSGAEIEQAIRAALHDAFAAGADLDTSRLLKALDASPPLSVTMAERVAELRAWAAGRCVPAE